MEELDRSPEAGYPAVLDVPFLATPTQVVEQILQLANLRDGDVLVDLGSGDGRMVIAAAKRYGIRATGIEADAHRVRLARENAVEEGVDGRVTFVHQNLFAADLRSASVVTMFLLSRVNLKLKPKLLRELRPGARVLSYCFDMGRWKPDRSVQIGGHKVYRWTIPGAAERFHCRTTLDFSERGWF